ncbi:MAG: hypothetical protein JWM31_1255 [Solirubrobacterales bacterium]|nr:hypothetical protein [Solirubrobacterales bacterium]
MAVRTSFTKTQFPGALGTVPPKKGVARPNPLRAFAGGEGVYTIACPANNITLNVFSGEASPILAGGFGGWVRISRPHRVSLTDWQGVDPYTMTLAIRMDGWAARRNIEGECQALRDMGRNLSDRSGPPAVFVDGPVPLGAGRTIEWRIDDITWGDSLWETEHGKSFRVRQDAVLALVQYVKADTVAIKSPAAKAAAASAAKKKTTAKKSTGLKSLKSSGGVTGGF